MTSTGQEGKKIKDLKIQIIVSSGVNSKIFFFNFKLKYCGNLKTRLENFLLSLKMTGPLLEFKFITISDFYYWE